MAKKSGAVVRAAPNDGIGCPAVRAAGTAARVLVCVIAALSVRAAHAGTDPATDYLLHCAGCHQRDGSGLPRSGIPSMVGNVGHFLRSASGRAFLVQVPGTAHSPLSDAQVAALLNWMLARFSAAQLPRDAAPYTAAEVTRLRGIALRDLPAARRAIVAELAAQGIAVR
jgi:cytochrome c553